MAEYTWTGKLVRTEHCTHKHGNVSLTITLQNLFKAGKKDLVCGINSFGYGNCFNELWLFFKNRGNSLQLPWTQLAQLFGQAFEVFGCSVKDGAVCYQTGRQAVVCGLAVPLRLEADLLGLRIGAVGSTSENSRPAVGRV